MVEENQNVLPDSTNLIQPSNLKELSLFTCDEILINEEISQVYAGRFEGHKNDERAIVKITARKLDLPAPEKFKRMKLSLRSESGAEYSYYEGKIQPTSPTDTADVFPKFDVQIISPASEKQINRYRRGDWAMIFETPEMYQNATKKYITDTVGDGTCLNWLYNVLDGKKELERIIYNDSDPENGFVINVDTKWFAHPNCLEVLQSEWMNHEKMDLNGLYCLGIARKKGIMSLRDLRGEHLPMLREIYRAGLAVIKDIYGVDKSKLRVFVHYMPQFFSFHVHFTSYTNQINALPEKAHLLPDIIQNLEMDSDYYEKRVMQYCIIAGSPLYNAIEPFLATSATASDV